MDTSGENKKEDPRSKDRLSEDHSRHHEERTKWVVYLTAVTMVVEIYFGYRTKSMALLADGWHMASHVFALGLTWVAYVIARKFSRTEKYSFDKKKLLALSGFSSAIILQIVAILMAVESVQRLLNPITVNFGEAILVAVIGLAVNALSAIFLHHDHEHHDHNIRSAYLHVLADGLTSMTAIIALTVGMIWQIVSLDSISGIISSLVITKWAVELIKNSGRELIDFSKH
jgi:cation diffusion facilitator family transporter